MKTAGKIYTALIAASTIGVGALIIPGIVSGEGCKEASAIAGSDAVMQLAAKHPEGVPEGSPTGVSCNVDGGFSHAGFVYGYGVPEAVVVDYYTREAAPMGWMRDREGEPISAEVGGFCFSREIEGRWAMIRVRFDTAAKTYSIRSEVALNDSRPRCWI
ncbi:hypothetical protein ACFV1L_13275 [Kitasatospora sp. NPDC059646]|uniref:hypothetical protein n=1 Tax=Kitasatospora sp. NPDC059646 TaxID=3346893 RepID=UPI00368EEE4C